MDMNEARQGRRLQTWSLGLLFLLLIAAIPAAFAQIITSSVTGFVTDPSGAAIPGARVTLQQVETGFTRAVMTSNLGEYRVVGIPAGTYTLTVEKSGFQTILKSNQTITQQLAARIDFVMQVGSVRQTVTVHGAAPLLQTETPANAVTLSARQISQLPTLGGSYLALAILSPGVLPTVGNSILNVVEGQSLTGGAAWKPVSIDASGGPPDLTGFVEDGFDVRDPIYGGDLYQPSVESIQSVRVVRGFDTSQYGGEPSVVYINTKSGANQYHGSVFEDNEVGALSARPFGTNHNVPLTYNQAGWSFGGPVTPKLRNKTFFFASFQLTRNRSGNPILGIVPTAAEWGGDLSAIPAQIYNPFKIVNGQRSPFSGNQIPSGLLSPFAQKLKQYVPLPNIPNAPFGSANLSTIGSQLNDDTQYLIRVDQVLPHSGRFFVKYFRDRVNAVSSGLSKFAGIAQPLRGQSASIEWDQPLGGGNMVNQLRLAFFRSVTDFGAVPTAQNIAGAVLGLKNVSSDPFFYGLPAIGVTGISLPSTLLFNLHRLTTRGGVTENLTRIQGRHSIDLGFVFQPTQYPQKNGEFPRGDLAYGGGFTSQSPGGPGGAGLSDFLLGAFSSAEGNPTGFDPLLNTAYWAWYAQDQIKATRKLTFNLGVRWDYWEPPTERYNRWAAFDQNTGMLEYTLKDPLNFQTSHAPGGALTRGLFENWKKTNFSPRFGFAYQLKPNTTVRGGFGMYYAQGMANFQEFASLGFGAPPFTNISTVTNDTSLLTPGTLDTQLFPAPAVGALTPGTIFVSQDIHAPQAYVEQATFSAEHQLGHNMLVSAGYNGTFGHHVMAPYNLNQAALYNPNNPLPLAKRVPYPFFSDILLESNSGNSTYNALNLHFEKRYSHGLDLTANYTWSKSMDMFSSNSGG
ncbi:MAG: TonB-dependent receptor, partial [Acidobacteriota bacterium]|nr:TonB-dependent receptor [Acidobacteriota bacterium]